MLTTEVAMIAAIKRLQLSGTPAEKIIKRPGNALWQYGNATPVQMAEQLCRNVHWYGRNGSQVWSWAANAGTNNTGEALARGTTNQTNCGGFNITARWIGINVLGLDPALFLGSYTTANDYFVTLAGTQAIDRNWHGSVRTLTQDFNQINAYFFKGHSWSKYGGNMLDASTNVMNFNTKTDLYWCALHPTNNPNASTQGRALMVTQRHQHLVQIPGPGPYACVEIKALKTFRHLFPIVITGGGQGVTQGFINSVPESANGWQNFLLVSREHLPQAFRQAVHLH